jgi:hypothetical protein
MTASDPRGVSEVLGAGRCSGKRSVICWNVKVAVLLMPVVVLDGPLVSDVGCFRVSNPAFGLADAQEQAEENDQDPSIATMATVSTNERRATVSSAAIPDLDSRSSRVQDPVPGNSAGSSARADGMLVMAQTSGSVSERKPEMPGVSEAPTTPLAEQPGADLSIGTSRDRALLTDPADRFMEPDYLRPEVRFPTRLLGNSFTPIRIAIMGRVPLGFEGSEPESEPSYSEPRSLIGMTVRDALDALVRVDQQYSWRTVNGVIVLRPSRAWLDPENVLNQPVADIDWDNVTAQRALFRVMTSFRGTDARRPGPEPPGPPFDPRPLSVHVRSGSLMDFLNELVRVHGGLTWRLVHMQNPKLPAAPPFRIELQSFDGRGVAFLQPR